MTQRTTTTGIYTADELRASLAQLNRTWKQPWWKPATIERVGRHAVTTRHFRFFFERHRPFFQWYWRG